MFAALVRFATDRNVCGIILNPFHSKVWRIR